MSEHDQSNFPRKTTPVRHKLLLLVALTLVLPACATRQTCEHAQPHMDARMMPALIVPEGVEIPAQVERLRVPAESKNRVTPIIRETSDSGKTSVRCLQDPPKIPAERS